MLDPATRETVAEVDSAPDGVLTITLADYVDTHTNVSLNGWVATTGPASGKDVGSIKGSISLDKRGPSKAT